MARQSDLWRAVRQFGKVRLRRLIEPEDLVVHKMHDAGTPIIDTSPCAIRGCPMQSLRRIFVRAYAYCLTRRRRAVRLTCMMVAALGLAVAVGIFGPAGWAAERGPNFVLVMADDQGWGDVAYSGNRDVKTPVLDEMARTALRLDRFYAAAPVCSPTRGSVLTGRHPNRFGCFSWGHTLRPEEVTLAEELAATGYATGHFGKWHLGPVAADVPN